MTDEIKKIIDKLTERRSLEISEYEALINAQTPKIAEQLASLARFEQEKIYGKSVFIRGLIEISNICKNDCYYCGIRASNRVCERYRLTAEQILDCCSSGYQLGFRTFVLQGGEDGYFTDEMLCDLIKRIKGLHPDCAVTLSLGERSHESYAKLRLAGADRYLLREETANPAHYGMLHPPSMSHERRIECLKSLKALGYQVGVGFMVGSPYQSTKDIALDLKFIEEFKPSMCGIGPFIPQTDTPFGNEPAGSAALTCYLISILRIMNPSLLLPSTTALGSISENGREMGILAGANVVMPNLSPSSVRKKYALYNNKVSDGSEAAEGLAELKKKISSIGYEITVDRGDPR